MSLPTETPGIIAPRAMQKRLRELACDRRLCPCRETARNGQGLTHCPLHPLTPEPTLLVTILPDYAVQAECTDGCDQMRLWRGLVGDVVIAWEKARWEGIVAEPLVPRRKPKAVRGVEVPKGG